MTAVPEYAENTHGMNILQIEWLFMVVALNHSWKICKKGIQTRAIFTGNILRQPMMKNKYYKKHRKSHLVSDDVMKNGILIGCHHGLKKKDLYRIINIFKNILS